MLTALALLAALSTSREITRVEVVEVPVYVTTRGGQPVTGLKAENFELFVNGKPQTIDYFDTLDFAEVSADARVPRQRRLYFLLFDLSSDVFALQRAREAVDRFVASAPDSDVFAVGTLDYGRLRIVAPFTPDRDSVRYSLRHIRANTSDPLRLSYGAPGGASPFVTADRYAPETELSEEFSDMTHSLMQEPMRRALVGMVGAMEWLTQELAPLEGHKHIVLLSSGFDTTVMFGGRGATPIANVHQGPLDTTTLQTASMQTREGRALPEYSWGFGKALDDLAARSSSASVFIDAVDIAGLRPTIGGQEKDSLYLVARNGQVIGNRNNITQAMEVLSDTQRSVYILGFHATNTGREENGIRLRLRDVAGHPQVSYRRSFSTKVSAPTSTDALFLADVVTNDIPQNGISLSTSVTVDRGTATLSVAVPGREILALGAGEVINGDAIVYVFSGSRAVAFHHKKISIDTRRARTLEDNAVNLRANFDLPPGTYAAKVLVRVDGADARGFTRSDFVVAP